MKRSTDRILTTHAGSLPRPDDVRVMVTAKSEAQPYDESTFEPRLRGAVSETVQQQLSSGIDLVNDGELAKSNFSNYAKERISGIETQPNPEPANAVGVAPRDSIIGRDVKDFAEYFAERAASRFDCFGVARVAARCSSRREDSQSSNPRRNRARPAATRKWFSNSAR